MAYQFADSFDNYNTASSRYESVVGTVTYSSAYARFAPPAGLPGQGIKCNAQVRKNLKSNQATHIIFVAVNFGALGGVSASGNPFLSILDNGTFQWSLVVFNSGAIGIIRSNTGAVQATTGPGAVVPGAYYGFEVQVTVGASAAAQVYLNGVQILNVSGLNTQVSANAYGNQVEIGDINNTGLGSPLFDDFRVWDSTGVTQNALVGRDRRMVTKLPLNAGTQSQWTPNGAAANWQCVDENPPNGDSTYVSSTAASTFDNYAMPSAGLTSAPTMVVALSYARKDDSATRGLANGVLSSGASFYGTQVIMSSTYAWVDTCIAVDPFTSAAWSAAGADAANHAKNEST